MWASSAKDAKSWREGAWGSAVAWPRPPAPAHCAVLRVNFVQGPEGWGWGGDGIKPPVLGSSSLTSVMVPLSCPEWEEMLEKCHRCNSYWG